LPLNWLVKLVKLKFEKLLQIYWLKGFLSGGEVVPFETPVLALFHEFPGLASHSFMNLARRLELSTELRENPLCTSFTDIELRTINVYLAQLASINIPLLEYEQKAATRYYLIKSYRGRRQALGKPSRGQRTWSNANTAFRASNHIKAYIAHFKQTHIKVEVVQKINYKVVQRRVTNTGPRFIKKAERKPITVWL